MALTFWTKLVCGAVIVLACMGYIHGAPRRTSSFKLPPGCPGHMLNQRFYLQSLEGRCYWFVPHYKRAWHASGEFCAAKGAKRLEIKVKAELEFITYYMDKFYYFGSPVWLKVPGQGMFYSLESMRVVGESIFPHFVWSPGDQHKCYEFMTDGGGTVVETVCGWLMDYQNSKKNSMICQFDRDVSKPATEQPVLPQAWMTPSGPSEQGPGQHEDTVRTTTAPTQTTAEASTRRTTEDGNGRVEVTLEATSLTSEASPVPDSKHITQAMSTSEVNPVLEDNPTTQDSQYPTVADPPTTEASPKPEASSTAETDIEVVESFTTEADVQLGDKSTADVDSSIADSSATAGDVTTGDDSTTETSPRLEVNPTTTEVTTAAAAVVRTTTEARQRPGRKPRCEVFVCTEDCLMFGYKKDPVTNCPVCECDF